MTVSTTAYATTVSGNGATTVFNFSFIADNANTIQVTYTDANGVQTVLSPGSYTLVINTPPVGGLWGIGGTVTYPLVGSPIASGTTLTIQRTVPYTQDVSIANQGAFYPQSVEQGLDLLELQVQQIQGGLLNTVRAPVVDGVLDMVLPAAGARANKFLLFNSAGQPTISAGVPSTTPIGAGSILFFLSGYASLALADAAAAAVSGNLIIDQNTSLSGNTILTTKTLIFSGGKITRGSNNLTVNNIIAGDVAIFDKAGTGTVTITHGPVNVTWFGVSKDGSTDDTAAINRALASNTDVVITNGNYAFSGSLTTAAANTVLRGEGPNTVLKALAGTGQFLIAHGNFTVKDLTYAGIGTGFILGNAGLVKDTKIFNINFGGTTAGQPSPGVSLATCQQVWVDQCYFFQVTYGILQQGNRASSSIKITNNLFEDMYADPINFNGASASGQGNDILIDGNTHLGTHSYPTPKTEERFVALTATSNVRITNNYVQHCAGDAPIHIETTGGSTSAHCVISGNTFFDCVCSGGNDGYIYIASSGLSDLTVTNNYFLQSSALTGQYAFSNASNGYSFGLIFNNNFIFDLSAAHSFGGLNLGFYNGNAVINGNLARGLDNFLYPISLAGTCSLTGNRVEDCTTGVNAKNSASGGAGNNITIDSNSFDTLSYSILGLPGAAALPPIAWCVRNNKFSSSSGAHDGVSCVNAVQSWACGNWYGSNLTNTTIASAPGTNTTEKNDFKQGTGLIHP